MTPFIQSPVGWVTEFFSGLPKCLKHASLLFFAQIAVLLCIGVLFIYGTGNLTGGAFAGMWEKQLVWIFLGGVSFCFFMRVPYQHLGRLSGLIYLVSVFLLILVLVIGREENGAKSWIRLGGGANLQPSEVGKLGTIFLLCWYSSREWVNMEKLMHLLVAGLIVALPVGLILLQPDMGSAMTFIPMFLGVIWISGMQKKVLVIGALLALLSAYPIYQYGMSSHQKERIVAFFKPEEANKQRAGLNAHQSLLAVGSGGVTGKGYMQGTQHTLGFLPHTVATNDFIFSVIAEETGFMGSALVIGCFASMIVLIFFIASKARDPMGRNLATAIGVLLSVHIYVNIGMTMGMSPIIGIPLPFVSYGGSFMIIMMSFAGIIQNVCIQRRHGGLDESDL